MSDRPTQPYHCPPVCDFPPAAECTRDQLLDIVERTIRGCYELYTGAGQPYVAAICELVEKMDLERSTLIAEVTAQAKRIKDLVSAAGTAADHLAIAQGLSAHAQSQLQASRDGHNVTALNLKAARQDLADEQDDSRELRAMLATRDTELADALALGVKLQRETLRITGKTPAQLTAEWAASDLAEHQDLERRQLAAQRQSVVARAYRDPDPVLDVTGTLVVDLECLDEPSVSRTITPRVAQPTMAELVASRGQS